MSKSNERNLAENLKVEVSLWELYGILYNMTWHKNRVKDSGDWVNAKDIEESIEEIKEDFEDRIKEAYKNREVKGNEAEEMRLKEIVDCFGKDGWLNKI